MLCFIRRKTSKKVTVFRYFFCKKNSDSCGFVRGVIWVTIYVCNIAYVLAVDIAPLATHITPLATDITPLATHITPLATHITPLRGEKRWNAVGLLPILYPCNPYCTPTGLKCLVYMLVSTDITPLQPILHPYGA